MCKYLHGLFYVILSTTLKKRDQNYILKLINITNILLKNNN